MSSPVVEVLGDVARTFEDLGARWYLMGAQAAILHGSARLSADVDVTVWIEDSQRSALRLALQRHGFDLAFDDDAFFEATRVLPAIHRATRMDVDVVLAGPGLEEHFLSRVEPREIGEQRIFVACAEDVIVMKSIAGRDRDLEDIEGICAANRDTLDAGYIRSLLAEIESALARDDIVAVFERAWKSA